MTIQNSLGKTVFLKVEIQVADPLDMNSHNPTWHIFVSIFWWNNYRSVIFVRTVSKKLSWLQKRVKRCIINNLFLLSPIRSIFWWILLLSISFNSKLHIALFNLCSTLNFWSLTSDWKRCVISPCSSNNITWNLEKYIK